MSMWLPEEAPAYLRHACQGFGLLAILCGAGTSATLGTGFRPLLTWVAAIAVICGVTCWAVATAAAALIRRHDELRALIAQDMKGLIRQNADLLQRIPAQDLPHLVRAGAR